MGAHRLYANGNATAADNSNYQGDEEDGLEFQNIYCPFLYDVIDISPLGFPASVNRWLKLACCINLIVPCKRFR